MEERNEIDINNSVTKFCVSFIAVNVAAIGMERFVDSWNCHCISGKYVLCLTLHIENSLIKQFF